MSIKNAKANYARTTKKMVQPQAKNTFVNTSRELQDPSVLLDWGKMKLNFAL